MLELFGAGTACVVSPVSTISYLGQRLHIPTVEQDDPLYKRFRKTLTDIQYGHTPHPWAVTID
ncbi:hypothetical protein L9F63_010460 [Diploptera punctata]|uniref:Uncharacterized protein n=1 Tax=Diploptera punctata TaxID=6984 RepID=A0AAD8EQM1_DIPPU|nr:hypothetical protein L9F63_010460 [Diploptera punctata]